MSNGQAASRSIVWRVWYDPRMSAGPGVQGVKRQVFVLGAALALVGAVACKKRESYRYHLDVPSSAAGFGALTDERYDLFADGKALGSVGHDLNLWVPSSTWLTKSKVTLRMPTTCSASDNVLLTPRVASSVEERMRDDTPESVALPVAVKPEVERHEIVVDNLDGGEALSVTVGVTAFEVPAGKSLRGVVRVGQCGWPEVTVGGEKVGPLPHAKLVRFGDKGGEVVLVDGRGGHCYVADDAVYTAPGEPAVASRPRQHFSGARMYAIADIEDWFSRGPWEVKSRTVVTRRYVDRATCGGR